MKTSLTLIAAAACGIACTAHAQSSVTLYGIVDAGYRYNSNAGGKSQSAIAGGNESASRFGITGSEDLGGGYRAVFTLENGFTTTTGALQAGLMFGRQAFVGLGTPFGTVTLGRQYLTLSSYLGPFEAGSDWAARGAGWGYHPGGLDDVDGTERANNAIKYVSPRYRGLQVSATYSLGGVAGDVTRNGMISAGADYAQGPFKLAAAYLFVKNPNYSLFGNNATSSATGNNISSPVFSGYATAGSQQVFGAGTSYDIGKFTLGGIYTNTKFADLGATAVAGATLPASEVGRSVTFNTAEANLKYRLTPALQFGLAYAYTRASSFNGQSGASYQQWNLGANYALSKRTDLYCVVLHEKAAGYDSTGHRAVAALTSATPSASDTQTGFTVGIRHLF
ncbi:porin [Paraburkholderia susongensis]|uniref:Outer membrane protein (Porin) n=1 Tax=Paraburkholderia susongensis TaxID=1515439 RepID=A0A1X7KYW6_9BURK|nr:porin [Paraburkholderia susongensis]SMG46547.1 Outer membrane protein (porin) [Paraburkholderia susongensis]